MNVRVIEELKWKRKEFDIKAISDLLDFLSAPNALNPNWTNTNSVWCSISGTDYLLGPFFLPVIHTDRTLYLEV